MAEHRLHRRRFVVGAVLAGVAPALAPGASLAQTPGATPADGGLVAPDVTIETVPPAVEETKGPGGETATSYREVRLTSEEVAQIQEGDYTAALVMHTSSAFTRAVEQGALDAFEALGIEVVARTEAGWTRPSSRATSRRSWPASPISSSPSPSTRSRPPQPSAPRSKPAPSLSF